MTVGFGQQPLDRRPLFGLQNIKTRKVGQKLEKLRKILGKIKEKLRKN
jgi:hypothetical protein